MKKDGKWSERRRLREERIDARVLDRETGRGRGTMESGKESIKSYKRNMGRKKREEGR